MKKLIVLITFVVLAAIGAYYLRNKLASPAPAPVSENEADVKDAAWNVFQKYLTAAKAHDINTLTALSYQISDACKKAASSSDCFAKMDNVYKETSGFKESEFTTVWYDAKQIILISDWHEEQTDLAFGYGHHVIYFTRTSKGVPQFLSVTLPEEIVYTLKGKDETVADWRTQLAPRIKDSDSDGLADEVEQCSYPNAPKTCVKTDATKRDTNGNGWWDSIEGLFYTKTPQQ